MGWDLMRNRRVLAVLTAAFALAPLSFGLFNEAQATKGEKVKVNPDEMKSASGNPIFGKVSQGDVQIVAEDAKVVVKRSKTVADVTVASNTPRHWNLQGSQVRQCGFAAERKGTSMMADALGSRAVVNGQVYSLPSGGMRGLQMGKDGVFINGQKVEPMKGSDVPGPGGTEDVLEITVPETFSGLLKIGVTGKSNVSIDRLKGGSLECYLLGGSSLTVDKLEDLQKTVLDNRGTGNAEVGSVSTKVLVANTAGTGGVTIKAGSADVSNATVSGAGVIRLNGKYKDLKQAVDGTGKIEVTP